MTLPWCPPNELVVELLQFALGSHQHCHLGHRDQVQALHLEASLDMSDTTRFQACLTANIIGSYCVAESTNAVADICSSTPHGQEQGFRFRLASKKRCGENAE